MNTANYKDTRLTKLRQKNNRKIILRPFWYGDSNQSKHSPEDTQ
jgi:hypothetical protein